MRDVLDELLGQDILDDDVLGLERSEGEGSSST
jgi:hypothetical protein